MNGLTAHPGLHRPSMQTCGMREFVHKCRGNRSSGPLASSVPATDPARRGAMHIKCARHRCTATVVDAEAGEPLPSKAAIAGG